MPPRTRGENRGGSRGGRGQAPPPPPPPSPPPPPPRRIEKLSLRQNPPVFNGMGDSVEAETWVRALERIFKFLGCTDRERLTCVAFQLTGSADFWWEARQKIMTLDQRENLTWEEFKTRLYNKYIPKSYRKKKEAEFYNLKQGRMTVTEYDRIFCDMARYAPDQVDTDEKMSKKFRAGLRPEIRMTLASLGALSYPDALSRALDVEAAMPTEKPTPTSALNQTPFQPSIDKGKRKRERNPSGPRDKRPWQGHPRPPNPRQALNRGGQVGNRPPRNPTCSKCQRNHDGLCRADSDNCYVCGQKGHFAKDCPKRKPRTGMGSQPSSYNQQLCAIQAQPSALPS